MLLFRAEKMYFFWFLSRNCLRLTAEISKLQKRQWSLVSSLDILSPLEFTLDDNKILRVAWNLIWFSPYGHNFQVSFNGL